MWSVQHYDIEGTVYDVFGWRKKGDKWHSKLQMNFQMRVLTWNEIYVPVKRDIT